MKREIREVDAAKGWIQITECDERWYARLVNEGKTWDYVPSVTWILEVGYPKGNGFYRWLAGKGWDEAEAIKESAGDQGDKVHQGVQVLLSGGRVNMGDSFVNPSTMQPEPLTPHEYLCLMTLKEWADEEQPIIIELERPVWNEKYRYAGTRDIKCRLKSDDYRYVWVIDVKTSQHVWATHICQVSAYKHATSEQDVKRLGILQLGYMKNKYKKWKFTRVTDEFGLFLAAKKIWERECQGIVPLQRDYPVSLSLNQEVANVSNALSRVLPAI
jgi:hypothetical protein